MKISLDALSGLPRNCIQRLRFIIPLVFIYGRLAQGGLFLLGT
jgi:hypothetical protein